MPRGRSQTDDRGPHAAQSITHTSLSGSACQSLHHSSCRDVFAAATGCPAVWQYGGIPCDAGDGSARRALRSCTGHYDVCLIVDHVG